MDSLPDADQRKAVVEKAAQMLSEHWDNVQILCSTVEDDETFRVRSGRGNMYARLGQAQEWIDWTKAQTEKDAVDEISGE